MLFDDTYRTISQPAEGSFSDRGSKFVGYGYPINSESDAKNILAEVRIKHPKARHHCWAHRLSTDRSVFRINDDGEPSGSAGRPILNTLFSLDVTNLLIIVVRYFGGTLLGIPGLINAYKSTALQTLNAACIIEKTVNDIYRIEFNYLNMNDIMQIIKQQNLQLLNQYFDTNCVAEVGIRKSQVNQAVNTFTNITGTSLKYLYTV